MSVASYTLVQTQLMATDAECCSATVAYNITLALQEGQQVSNCRKLSLKYIVRAAATLKGYIPAGAIADAGKKAYTALEVTAGSNFTLIVVTNPVDGELMNTSGSWATIQDALDAISAALTSYGYTNTTANNKIYVYSPIGYYNGTSFNIFLTETPGDDPVEYTSYFVGGQYLRTTAMNCLTDDNITTINENIEAVCCGVQNDESTPSLTSSYVNAGYVNTGYVI